MKRSTRLLAIVASALAPLVILQAVRRLCNVETSGLAISTTDIQANLICGRDDTLYAS